MIRGVHTLLYSSEPDALRAFLRDKLAFTAHDIGHGWLIFDMPEADMGVHPAGTDKEPAEPAGTHQISFYCDDLEATIAELAEKGVEMKGPVEDHGWGLVTSFDMPGGVTTMLYQPQYKKG